MRHETSLERRKPFPCDFQNCQYRAAVKSAVELHIQRRHTTGRTKNEQCPLCPKKFFTLSLMKAHLHTHIKEEKHFKCNLCPFEAAQECYLRRHIKQVHEEPVKFKCDFPGRDYSAREKRLCRRHYLSHKSDPVAQRPFPCTVPQCDYRAFTKLELRGHVNCRYNPDRSPGVECPLCSQRIRGKENLKHHINRVHTRKKTFKCDQCDYSAAQHGYLKTHYQMRHEKTE